MPKKHQSKPSFCFVDTMDTSAKPAKSDIAELAYSIEALIRVSRLAVQGPQDGSCDLEKSDILAVEQVLKVAQQLSSDLWSHIDEADFT